MNAIREDPEISALLATYGGRSAVFYQTAPADKAPGWNGVQYPRVDYLVDWTFDPERHTDGSLVINVWTLNNGTGAKHWTVGDAIRERLRDLFLTAKGVTYAIEWQRTDVFEAGGQAGEPLTEGETLSFDILAFPRQATTDPDPAEGMSDMVKAILPACRVVGLDELPELVKPTAEQPVVYVRTMSDGSAMRNSWAVAWMDVNLAVHVFAPDQENRISTIRALCNAMAMEGECPLRDGSPMLLKRLAIQYSANPLRQGQITVTGRYGILRQEAFDPINHAGFRRE